VLHDIFILQTIANCFSVSSAYTVSKKMLFLLRYHPSSAPIWLDNFNNCTSSSTDLRMCAIAVGVTDCSHHEDVILTCYGGETSVELD